MPTYQNQTIAAPNGYMDFSTIPACVDNSVYLMELSNNFPLPLVGGEQTTSGYEYYNDLQAELQQNGSIV